MSSFLCPYCHHTIAVDYSTHRIQRPSFIRGDRYIEADESEIEIDFYKCPNCGEYSIYITGTGKKVLFGKMPIKPISSAIQFPNYIPQAIREDYEEACAILNLSPKASATLARRCLQSMIHDFWNIHDKNLYVEISKLKAKVSPTLWKVLDSVRSIGNIGAHMEHDINLIVDIDHGEAEKLTKLIEFLIKEWYINRHEQELLFSEIIDIAETKENKRKGNE